MHLRISQNSQVWRYWHKRSVEGRVGARLSPTPILILAFLEDHGEAYQIQIAAETGLNQGNLSARHLPNLTAMDLITYVEVERLHLRRPNQPSKRYRITDHGIKVLELLGDYDNGERLLAVMNTGPYFAQGRARIARPTIPSRMG
jgi:DNA-binding MarR family transcriptional regulator